MHSNIYFQMGAYFAFTVAFPSPIFSFAAEKKAKHLEKTMLERELPQNIFPHFQEDEKNASR